MPTLGHSSCDLPSKGTAGPSPRYRRADTPTVSSPALYWVELSLAHEENRGQKKRPRRKDKEGRILHSCHRHAPLGTMAPPRQAW
jgi:hypothetical protein